MRMLSVYLLLMNIVTCYSNCVMTECNPLGNNKDPPCKTNNSSIHPITFVRSKNQKMFDILEKHCSHLLRDENQVRLCCTDLQLRGMSDRLESAVALLGSCPSCLDNFSKLWCEFTCSTEQSRFMKVIETSGPEQKVEKMQLRVNRDFAEGLFESCKNTWFGNTLALAWLSMYNKVTFENFYSFMGTKKNESNIPMHTDFQFTTDKKAMNIPMTPCYKSAGPNLPACGLINCPLVSYQLMDFSNIEPVSIRGKRVFEHQIINFEWILKLSCCLTLTSIFIFFLKYSCHQNPKDRDGCYIEFGTGGLELRFEHLCGKYAYKMFQIVIHYPLRCVLFGLLVASICCFGNIRFHSLAHSIDQVSASDGETRRNQKAFIETFGPTHRIEQIFITLPQSEEPACNNVDFFEETFLLIENIQNITVNYKNTEIRLDDICYKPLGKRHGCAIMSPTNYFQNKWNTFLNAPTPWDFDYDDNGTYYWDHLKICVFNPRTPYISNSEMSCFGDFGGPIDPVLIFGSSNETGIGNEKYFTARTVMITIVLEDHEEKSVLWETAFLNLMSNYTLKHGDFTFMAESSVTKELQETVETDKLVSVLACAAVLFWVATMIGIYHWPEWSPLSAFLHKCLVVISDFTDLNPNFLMVYSSIGVFSFCGQHATDNAIVVLFFVISLIGINRIFHTVRTFQTNGHCYGQPDISNREMNNRITATIRKSIPIVFTNSLICSTCFFLAGGVPPYISVNMPAVEVFSRHAGLAILFDTSFYLLVILPLFQYDARREMVSRTGRCEIWPWFELSDHTKTRLSIEAAEGTIRSPVDWFKLAIAPLLLSKSYRIVVLIIFTITFISSIYCTRKLEFGFDQTMAFSKTSYLTKHFQNMNKNLNVGPPVYFVIEGLINWHEPQVQKKFCSQAGCDENSMGNKIRTLAFSENPKENFLNGEVYIWLDSYLQFMHPRGSCCKTDGRDFCKFNR
ncbi:CRE-NCR-2 protein [Caenorhabditis remanei]|uniref:CRE-NCR-2 protein n=1 Tax=Caenorhabditis remanei TaxID=31234 RepID=E3LT08_CAERE|nr:CRE-NCR-2 protein [Caenorhabditis remanei]